ncbi:MULTISPECIES: hypothetical protein [Bacillus]|nr:MULTISPECIES: hypothetical protein [Bacillus cereus group]MDA1973094.1 hypothetical protein [Bacillus cereus]
MINVKRTNSPNMSAELIRELRRLQEYIIQVGDEAVEQKRENKESL